MHHFSVKDPNYSERVRSSFNQQQAMRTLGTHILNIEPGVVELGFKHCERLTQQHGFIHAGIVSTVLDSACGYAAFSLMPVDTAVLTIEFKINLLAPAKGDSFIAIGQVKKPGRTITVCDGELYAVIDKERKLVATMTATLMAIENREGIND